MPVEFFVSHPKIDPAFSQVGGLINPATAGRASTLPIKIVLI